ncbi:hypothetical protein [Corallococcus macrosporus]|uniref:Uncharacterized protein n=1 Tax=Myxococcus fulvus (strain ATCC BAA-855 / HW-1) TaxID=483219 RepID=F8CH44_MYXFH|nr:hypothetical protein [Corallococcus macrosporus]AEI64961.1 hypothetical protein LILAB_15290 [Corallococcus macrosporus]
MTEPVDGWIRGAGERCIALGKTKLGQALITHARHEAGHHLMTLEDARTLARRWNTRHARGLDCYLRFLADCLRAAQEGLDPLRAAA